MSQKITYPFPAGREGVFKALIQQIIAGGGTLIFPTETFYALGGSARDETVVAKIFRLKGRRRNVPFPLLIDSPERLTDLAASVPPAAAALTAKFWPGPLTLVFTARPGLPAGTVSTEGKVALRVSSHPLLRELAAELTVPLIATSANRHGEPAAADLEEIDRQLLAAVDLVIDGGRCAGGRPSTIVDISCRPPRLIREGAIPASSIFTPAD